MGYRDAAPKRMLLLLPCSLLHKYAPIAPDCPEYSLSSTTAYAEHEESPPLSDVRSVASSIHSSIYLSTRAFGLIDVPSATTRDIEESVTHQTVCVRVAYSLCAGLYQRQCIDSASISIRRRSGNKRGR